MEEIVIKVKHIKKASLFFIILALVIVIAIQNYYPNCSRCSLDDITTADTKDSSIKEENTEQHIEYQTVAETSYPEQSEVQDTETQNETADIEKDTTDDHIDTLPITGEIGFAIDKINVDPKPDIEDYAKVTSVKFTIVNQDKDFTPIVAGHLKEYENDEEPKQVTLEDLDAGKSVTITEKRLTFGYNNEDQPHTLVLKLYNEKNKLLKTITKTFTTN